MDKWTVPAIDPTNECWVTWRDDFGGFVLITQTRSGERFPYPGNRLPGTLDPRDAVWRDDSLPTVESLVEATWAAIDWRGADPRLLAALRAVQLEHSTPRQRAVADLLHTV